jgi:hypothetical protein
MKGIAVISITGNAEGVSVALANELRRWSDNHTTAKVTGSMQSQSQNGKIIQAMVTLFYE